MSMPHTFIKGFTLFDLLVTLAIASILFSLASPPLTDFLGKQLAEETSQTLAAQLRAARQLALTSGKSTVICGTQDGVTCNKNNFYETIIFIDEDNSHSINGTEIKLMTSNYSKKAGQLKLKASANSHYLKFTPEGYAQPYGSFHLCPQDSSKRQWIQRVSVRSVGRPYVAAIAPKYGEVRADASGKTPITCP